MMRKKLQDSNTLQLKAVIYCRVSSHEQAEHGVSLEAQERTLRLYCEIKKLDVVEVLIERAVSGSVPLNDRPNGQKIAVLIAEKKIGAVVVAKLDRAFRDTIDCLNNIEMWQKDGVAFHALDIGGGAAVDTSSYMGKFFITMIAAAAELERNRIRERIQEAMDHQKSQGKRFGAASLGEKLVDGSYVDDPEGQRAKERLLALTQLGYSRRRVASILNEEGYKTQRGSKFTHDTVQCVINQERANND